MSWKKTNSLHTSVLETPTERRTGNDFFTGTAFRAVPAYFHFWVYTVSATLVLDSSVFLRVSIDGLLLFHFPLCLLSFSLFLLPRSLSFEGKMRQEASSTLHAAGQRLGVSSPSWNASAQLLKLCTRKCAWLLKRLAFAEVGELTSSWHKNMNCCRATVVCLDAKGQSFILAGFTLSLPRSAPCGTEQTTIDTGCDPALLRNCVDHPAECNLFKTTTLLNSH